MRDRMVAAAAALPLTRLCASGAMSSAAPRFGHRRSCLGVFVLLFAWQSLGVSAQSTVVSVTPATFETGETPTNIVVQFTPTNALANSGDKVTITAVDSGGAAATFFGADATGVAVPTLSGAGFAGGTITAAEIKSSSSVYEFDTSATNQLTALNAVSVSIPSAALAALPAAGAYTFQVSTSGTINAAQSDSSGAFRIIAAPVVTWSGSMFAGSTPVSLSVQVTTPFALSIAHVITLTAAKAIFKSGIAATTVTGQSDVSMTNVNADSTFETTSTSQFKVTVQTASISANTALTITMNSAILDALPSNAGSVGLTIAMGVSGSPSTVVDTYVGWLTIGVAGDPVARFGNTIRVFELPPGELMPLITMPDLSIAGSVFQGGAGAEEQWFDRLLLTAAGEDRFVDIRMARNLHEADSSSGGFNISKAHRSSGLQTLEIRMGYGTISNPRFVTQIQNAGDSIPMSFLGYAGLVRKVQRSHMTRFTTVGQFPRECVELAGVWSHFYICSSPADEYYGELRHLSLKYAHLDLTFHEVKDYAQLEGMLPELWGLVPMSETTQAYVKEDKSLIHMGTGTGSGVSKALPALGLDELQKSCQGNASTKETHLNSSHSSW